MEEADPVVRDPSLVVRGGDDQFLRQMQHEVSDEARSLGAPFVTLDLLFYVYLRLFARFGYFTFGPLIIDTRLIGDIVDRTLPRGAAAGEDPIYSDDFVRFSRTLMDEVRRSGYRRIDELHFLLAFMRVDEGLPSRVFGELGVAPEQVEEFARSGGNVDPGPAKLYSPEEAAEYLGVHVQTVRGWIRSGRLRASRLAGQRALRISATDLQSVLEPVGPGDV
jgi:excisionase family DNA binding protein